MGALDFLKDVKGTVIDAATYGLLERNFQLQDDNNRLLKDKIEMLQAQHDRLKIDNERLAAEVEELQTYAQAANFVIEKGIAFKRRPDGTFELEPYCPNCRVVMSNPGYTNYVCPKCEYHKFTDVLAEKIAKQLNNQRI